jgi:predicted Zn-dependent peptidase
VAAFAAWLLVPVYGRCAPILDGSHIREHTLANGLHIIVKEERGWGVVAASACIRCGSLYDPADTPGIGHFVEHMLFRNGQDGGEPSPLVQAVEGRGGQLNAETNRDSTMVQMVTTPPALPDLWPVLARTLFEATFPENAVNEERKVISQEIAEREGDASAALTAAVWEAAYPHHPYGRVIGGSRESVERITPDQLRAYHAQFYVPNNVALVLTGDVAASEVFTQVQEAFAKYAQKPVTWTPPEPEPALDGPKTDAQTKDMNLTLLGYGFRAPGIARKRDVCAMDLIYTVLSDGRKARLTTEVEEKGLVNAFDFQFLTQRENGLVLLTAATTPDKELEARTALTEQLERLATDGVTDDELVRARRVLRNSYAFSNEAYSDQIGSLGFYEMIDTYRFAIDYIDAVNQVTADDVKRVASEYLSSDKAILVIFRPPAPRGSGHEV